MNHKINKKELTFIVISVILFIVLAGLVFYLINFLATMVNNALISDFDKNQQIVKFNIEELKKIKEIRQ